jgi:translation initiation factor 1
MQLPARVVLRLERKGRSGKVVTCVELRGVPSQLLADWLQELKRVLGCGGTLESGTLVLQGDQRQRLKGLFLERGVQQFSIG